MAKLRGPSRNNLRSPQARKAAPNSTRDTKSSMTLWRKRTIVWRHRWLRKPMTTRNWSQTIPYSKTKSSGCGITYAQKKNNRRRCLKSSNKFEPWPHSYSKLRKRKTVLSKGTDRKMSPSLNAIRCCFGLANKNVNKSRHTRKKSNSFGKRSLTSVWRQVLSIQVRSSLTTQILGRKSLEEAGERIIWVLALALFPSQLTYRPTEMKINLLLS